MNMTSNCNVTNGAHQIQMPLSETPSMKIFCERRWSALC